MSVRDRNMISLCLVCKLLTPVTHVCLVAVRWNVLQNRRRSRHAFVHYRPTNRKDGETDGEFTVITIVAKILAQKLLF